MTGSEVNARVDGIDYVLNVGDKNCTLRRVLWTISGTFTVPKSIKHDGTQYAVVGIGMGAFSEQQDVEELIFPADSEVTQLDFWCFQGMTKLRRLVLPPKVTPQSMQAELLRDTPNLTKVEISSPNFKVEADGCVYSADKKTLYFVPRSKSGVFRLDSNVIRLGGCAFDGCTGITAVEGTGKLERIGAWCFAGVKIKKFACPATLKSIGEGAFLDCADLAEFTFDSGCPVKIIPVSCFAGCTSLQSLKFEISVSKLRSRCFERTPSLTSVTFANNSELEVIEDDVFWSCGLTKLCLPSKVKTLGHSNFFDCGKLIDAEVTTSTNFSWDGYALYSGDETATEKGQKTVLHFVRRNILDFSLPKTVKEITPFAFYGCSDLRSVNFSQSEVEKIGASAFSFTGLKSVYVPGSVQEIGDDAFANCFNLTAIMFDKDGSLRSVGRGVFAQSAIEVCDLPSKVTSVGEFAFSQSDVRNVRLPADVRKINNHMFYGCQQLETVIALSKNLSIDETAFLEAKKGVVVKTCVDFTGSTFKEIKVVKQDNLDNLEIQAPRKNLARMPGRNKDEKVSAKSFELKSSDLTCGHKVEGANNVLVGTLVRDGTLCAVKRLDYETEDAREMANKEVNASVRFYFPALVGCLGVIFPVPGAQNMMASANLLLLLEYYPNGSLDKYIWDATKREVLTPTVIAKIIVGVAYGLRYMQKCKSYHRDVKPQNILLDENWEPKIADFGSIRVEELMKTNKTTTGFTLKYQAPEIWDGDYEEGVDMFSFSLMLWELVTGKDAYVEWLRRGGGVGGKATKDAKRGNDEKLKYFTFSHKIHDGERPNAEEIASEWFRKLIVSGWDPDPSQRPTFDQFIENMELKNYQVMDGVDDKEVKRYHEMLKEAEVAYPPKEIPADMLKEV